MKTTPKAKLYFRSWQKDDHHMFFNKTKYWIAITVHLPNGMVDRLRFSLQTADKKEAMRRRDIVFKYIQEHDNDLPSKEQCIKLWN